MAKGDQATLTCPYCGGTGTYTLRNENGTQNEPCARCRKHFTIELNNGQVTGVRK